MHKVDVHTSNVKGAGTDANVHIDIIGSTGSSGVRLLLSGEKDLFAKGQVDNFTLAIPVCLGVLCELRIWHDGKGIASGWHLNHAVVQDMKTGQVVSKKYMDCFGGVNQHFVPVGVINGTW